MENIKFKLRMMMVSPIVKHVKTLEEAIILSKSWRKLYHKEFAHD